MSKRQKDPEAKRQARPTETRALPMELVYPNPKQPRQFFDQASLEELGESIRRHGLLQPIKVRPDGEGRFMIVLGERRWRAHQLIGAAKITATLAYFDDDALAITAIVENLQRKDITPLEEARAYQERLDAGMEVEELAASLGMKQPWRITERTNLLRLATAFQDAFAKGLLTSSQCQELSRLPTSLQPVLFRQIREGRCRTYGELRAVTNRLVEAAARQGGETFSLTAFDQAPGTVDMFPGFHEPSVEEREVVTRMERKVQQVVDLLQGGFKDNEVVITAKVSPAKADTVAAQLELIEGQLRKLRLALRAEVAGRALAAQPAA